MWNDTPVAVRTHIDSLAPSASHLVAGASGCDAERQPGTARISRCTWCRPSSASHSSTTPAYDRPDARSRDISRVEPLGIQIQRRRSRGDGQSGGARLIRSCCAWPPISWSRIGCAISTRQLDQGASLVAGAERGPPSTHRFAHPIVQLGHCCTPQPFRADELRSSRTLDLMAEATHACRRACRCATCICMDRSPGRTPQQAWRHRGCTSFDPRASHSRPPVALQHEQHLLPDAVLRSYGDLHDMLEVFSTEAVKHRPAPTARSARSAPRGYCRRG